MTFKSKIDPSGRTEITEDCGQNPDGTEASRSWRIQPGQAGAHLPMFEGQLAAGDVSAMRDVANEAAKRKARGE